MRAKVKTPISLDDIPVNIYTVALATSGFGKGYSVNIMETQLLAGFAKRFREDTFPMLADTHMWKRALTNAANIGGDEQAERDKLETQFKRAGAVPFTFDSGTPAAVKQIREKLLLAEAGAINLQIDEIGSNLVNSTDILNVFLELYDQGKTKIKLIKNTAENERFEEIDGKTPSNMLLFGTPSKLLDGSLTEAAFFSFLDTGYARRSLFGWGEPEREKVRLTPQERLVRLTNQAKSQATQHLATHFTVLADPAKYDWLMTTDDAVTLIRSAYTAPVKKTVPKPTPKKKQAAVSADEPGIVDADSENETDDEPDPIPETSQESDDIPALDPEEKAPPAPTPAKAGSIFNFAGNAA